MKYLDTINSPEDLKKLNINSLELLCGEMRKFLIDSVSKTGGHFASNLGVVELSVALHYCFDSPTDKIIWDVGHQAYVHKILTGRRDAFDTLRQFGGISGFPRTWESPHDAFSVGHSSTSVSAGLGFCMSRDLKGEDYTVVSIIGDGSMTGGLAFEGLNNAGRLNSNMIVILNDNQMSISENVGALSKYLNDMRTAPGYLEAKADVHSFLNKVPFVGGKLDKMLEKAKDSVKYLLVQGAFFEELGFNYVGPLDGHDIKAIVDVLNRVKNMQEPVLLHLYTVKGKGYCKAEKSPTKFHGVECFDKETGKSVLTKIWDSYSDVFGKALCRLASTNEKIVAITAAMPEGTGLSAFRENFPSRLFDVGIAEGHAVTFAAAMAADGMIPVFAVYSTFLQRAYDQILHDCCLQNLHVVFAIDRAGLVGADGETHQGVFDISFLSAMPNMTILAPKNKSELITMLSFAISHTGPIAIRYPRGAASRVLKYSQTPIEMGKSEIVAQGQNTAIISLGSMMDKAYEVYTKLKDVGLNPTLINARFVKPLDLEMIASLKNYKNIYVLEDGIRIGGFGAQVLEAVAQMGINPEVLKIFAFPDRFIEHGETEQLFEKYGMDADSIYSFILAKENL